MTARTILLTATALVLCSPERVEAKCLTLSEARALGGYPRYHVHGPKRCWYVRGKDADAVLDRRHRRPTLTAADEKLIVDRADQQVVAPIEEPRKEVMQSGGDVPAAISETRPRSDALTGADTVPYWYEDDRPESLIMPTRDQWAPEEDHAAAVWWAAAAAVLSVAIAFGITSWPRWRARGRHL